MHFITGICGAWDKEKERFADTINHFNSYSITTYFVQKFERSQITTEEEMDIKKIVSER